MLLSELFGKYGIDCPDWLNDYYLDDDFAGAVYSKEDNNHKWEVKTEMKHVILTYDLTKLSIIGFDEDDETIIMSREITEDYEVQS